MLTRRTSKDGARNVQPGRMLLPAGARWRALHGLMGPRERDDSRRNGGCRLSLPPRTDKQICPERMLVCRLPIPRSMSPPASSLTVPPVARQCVRRQHMSSWPMSLDWTSAMLDTRCKNSARSTFTPDVHSGQRVCTVRNFPGEKSLFSKKQGSCTV